MSMQHANKNGVFVSPKVKSLCDGLVGDTAVQANKAILRMTEIFVEVTVPVYHNTNGGALKKIEQSPGISSFTNILTHRELLGKIPQLFTLYW